MLICATLSREREREREGIIAKTANYLGRGERGNCAKLLLVGPPSPQMRKLQLMYVRVSGQTPEKLGASVKVASGGRGKWD